MSHNPEHLVNIEDFSQIKGSFLDLIPTILKGNELRGVLQAIHRARENQKPIIWALGAHVIKCGLSPLIIDLMAQKLVTGVALNGAGAIHDFEIALYGSTSEDVEKGLVKGTFGMTRETAELMNFVINSRVTETRGIGEALAMELACWPLMFREYSLLAMSWQYEVSITVHISIGADVTHMHPSSDGAKLGQGSLNDFHLLTSQISQLDGGGVFLNIGSAVVLPEVFLKALNLARYQGHKIEDFTTVNLDMIQHYRPNINVVTRPHAGGRGKGYSLTGHHEIMLPLLYSLLTGEGNYAP